MGINREQFRKELREARRQYSQEDVLKVIDELRTDLETLPESEFNKWAIVNGDLIFSILPESAELYKSAATMREPDSWQEKAPDVKKIFNDDQIVMNWRNIPEQRIKGVAENAGYTQDQVQKELEQKELEAKRRDEMTLPILQEIFMPRMYENKIRNGLDSYNMKDVGLDLLENALYSVNPFGRVGQLIKNGPKIAKMISPAVNWLLKDAGNPFVMEGIDALAYDDPDNARSEFSTQDAVNGTITNKAAPWALKQTSNVLARKVAPGFNNFVQNLGKGSFDEVLKGIKANNTRYEELLAKQNTGGKLGISAEEQQFMKDWGKYYNKVSDAKLEEIANSKGGNILDKYKNWIKSSGKSETEQNMETIAALEKEFNKPISDITKKEMADGMKVRDRNAVNNKFMNSNYSDLLSGNLKGNRQLFLENALSDLVTNKYGDFSYNSDNNVRIPVVGALTEQLKAMEDKSKEEEARKNAVNKYRIKNMIGGK